MSAFDVLRNVLDCIHHQSILQTEQTMSKEPVNIDPEQICQGAGTVSDPAYQVPNHVAAKLNKISNPSRNGLVLLWAYNIHKILGGKQEKIMALVRFIYDNGEKTYSAESSKGGSKKGRKRKDETSESVFSIQPEQIGFGNRRPEKLASFTQNEYEKMKNFIEKCFLPSILLFQQKYSGSVVYKTVNFQNIAYNLMKASQEVSRAAEDDGR